MKRIVAALSMCCITLLALLLYEQAAEPTVPSSHALTVQEQQATPKYLVRVDGGVLSVYPYGSATACEVTDIRVSSLRAYDQQLMQRGFPLYSDEELASFLEDFGS